MSETEEKSQPTEQTETNTQPQEMNDAAFAEMLSDYEYELPKYGEIIEGRVIRLDEDAILIDVGLKRDAIVSGREYTQLDSDYLENLNPNDSVHVFVLRSPSGDQEFLVSINKGLEYETWSQIEQHAKAGTIMDLEVVGYNKGGLLVRYESLRGFVPASQVPELRRTNDRQRIQSIKQDMVGSNLVVKPIEVDRDRNRLVFSATAAQEERRQKRLKELEKDQIILRAKVVSVVDFGVFADLGGVDGLVHISQLDWRVVKHPSELFQPGDEVDVQIIDVDVERERVSLSRKALLPSPWDSLEERYRPGDVIQGKVTRVLDFGAFVEIEEGIEGLVHVSELGYSASGKPEELVSPGEEILVRILDINPKKERISLSMRRVPMGEQISWLAGEEEPAEAAPETETAAEEEPAVAGETEAATDREPVEEVTEAEVAPETETAAEEELAVAGEAEAVPDREPVEEVAEAEVAPETETAVEEEPVVAGEAEAAADREPVEEVAKAEVAPETEIAAQEEPVVAGESQAVPDLEPVDEVAEAKAAQEIETTAEEELALEGETEAADDQEPVEEEAAVKEEAETGSEQELPEAEVETESEVTSDEAEAGIETPSKAEPVEEDIRSETPPAQAEDLTGAEDNEQSGAAAEEEPALKAESEEPEAE